MSKKSKKKQSKRRNPFHQVMRELFKTKTLPDKKKKKSRESCRGKIKEE